MQRKTWPSKKRRLSKDSKPLSEKLQKRKKGANNCDSAEKKKRRGEGSQHRHLREVQEEPEDLEAPLGHEVLQGPEAQPPHLQAEHRAYRVAEHPISVEDLVRAEPEGHNRAKSGYSRFNDIYPIDLLIIISS